MSKSARVPAFPEFYPKKSVFLVIYYVLRFIAVFFRPPRISFQLPRTGEGHRWRPMGRVSAAIQPSRWHGTGRLRTEFADLEI